MDDDVQMTQDGFQHLRRQSNLEPMNHDQDDHGNVIDQPPTPTVPLPVIGPTERHDL